jgi:hypothetical protein
VTSLIYTANIFYNYVLNILIHIDIQLQSKQNAYSIKGFIIHVWMFAVWKVSGLDIESVFFIIEEIDQIRGNVSYSCPLLSIVGKRSTF